MDVLAAVQETAAQTRPVCFANPSQTVDEIQLDTLAHGAVVSSNRNPQTDIKRNMMGDTQEDVPPSLGILERYDSGSTDPELAQAENEAAANPSITFTKSPVDRELLSRLHVFSIIANRMIGTGIFATPTIILTLDQNIGASLILWSLGCLASVAGAWMYVEYGLTIPRRQIHGREKPVPKSGGELNYLNHLLKKPPYLATCLFGWTFILVGNSAANCISFGSHVLKAAYNNETPSPGLTTLVALAAAWVVFLTHSLGRMAGIHLNTAFAMLKVAILLMIVILGFMVRGNAVHYMSPTSEFPSDLGNFTFLANKTSWGYPFLVNGTYFYPSTNLNPTTSFREIGTNRPSGARFASAYLNIIFTFGGWNQANYVLGEVKKPSTRFRNTAMWSVVGISVLYLLVNIAYFIVVPMPTNGNLPDDYVVGMFFISTIGRACNNPRTALTLMNAFVAFSSLGNVIVTTFTVARVKQEIAKEGVLPESGRFSRNVNILKAIKTRWSSSGRGRIAEDTNEQPKSTGEQAKSEKIEPIPLPALLLHNTFATILILAMLPIRDPAVAYSVLVTIYSYTVDAMCAVCLSFGMMVMRLKNSSQWNTYSTSQTFRWFSFVAAFFVFCSNIFPIVAYWIPVTNPSGAPWMVTPAIGWSLVASGFFYWIIFYKGVPLVNAGRELTVVRIPIISDEDGEFVQRGELVEQKWEVPPDRRPRS